MRRVLDQVASGGRITVYFSVRYATPIVVLVAVAASGIAVRARDLTSILTAHMLLTAVTHVVTVSGGQRARLAAVVGIAADVALISGLVLVTGGVSGPLTFLFTLHALSTGILVSARAGARALALSTIAIILIDVSAGSPGGARGLPHGLTAAAALWIIGGLGTLFSAYNERELRRRNAELSTVRQVSLDIEHSLALDAICENLCRGVAKGFGFDTVAVLQPDGADLRCVGSFGATGSIEAKIPVRGRVAFAVGGSTAVVVTGKDARADACLTDLIGPRGYVAVPVHGGLMIATRMGRRGRPARLRAHEVEALENVTHHARLAIANARLHERVTDMARRDVLTGLFNRGEMQRTLENELGRVNRYAAMRQAGAQPSVVLLDVDHFKAVNDRHGHQAGDAVLRALAEILKRNVRSFDVVARYGGEEFAIILPGTDADSARDVVQRVRRAVAAAPLVTTDAGRKVKVTISAGIATASENGDAADQLFGAADAALYRSKEDGRNRVTHASDPQAGVAKVVAMDPKRRQERDAGRARGGSQRARAQSSPPKRRTPRA